MWKNIRLRSIALPFAVRAEIQFGDFGCGYRSNDFGEQRARVADIARRLAALDRGEDGLQQRAGIAARTRVAPQPGEVRRCAQFEHKRFLPPGDLDRFEKTSFRPRPVLLWLLQRHPTVEAMQFGKPELYSGLFNEVKGF